jgi:M3 family oligoendopeptidase
MLSTDKAPTLAPDLGGAPLTLDEARTEYDGIDTSLAASPTEVEVFAALRRWDALKRRVTAHVNRAELRFRQDTADDGVGADAAAAAALSAAAQSRDLAIKRHLLAHPDRPALEQVFGSHVFALWQSDALAFEPALEEDVVRESALFNEYTQLLAGVSTTFEGEAHSLKSLAGFAEDPDRGVRRAALTARWSIYEEHAPALDRIFDELVRCRAQMAAKLGYASFMELAYKKLGRTDYGPSDVARFRDAIRCDIGPLAQRIVDAQGAALGVDAVMPWDEGVYDRLPPIAILGGGDLPRAFAEGFASMDPQLGAFARLMFERDLLDLEARSSKAVGAFCTFFPDAQMPYVFVCPTGTSSDALTLVHEMGHAFQNYSARDKALVEEVLPTFEAGEIHSMAMEFLMWPEYERFAGDDADRYRSQHLRSMLLSLPYIAAIDHFQELVYAQPDASAGERHAMWRWVEARYLPHRRTGEIPHVMRGGLWQRQRHVYGFPFYYIDYGLALCCALQFWTAAQHDRPAALAAYIALCKRGGEGPFLQLVESAGLRSPFGRGALADVARHAADFLGLQA